MPILNNVGVEINLFIWDEFTRYWRIEEAKAIDAICAEENLAEDKFKTVLDNCIFTDREPLRDEVLNMLQGAKTSLVDHPKPDKLTTTQIMRATFK